MAHVIATIYIRENTSLCIKSCVHKAIKEKKTSQETIQLGLNYYELISLAQNLVYVTDQYDAGGGDGGGNLIRFQWIGA